MGMENNFNQPTKPADYEKELGSYVDTFNKSKSGELPKWGDKTQFDVAMEDLKNLAEGKWETNSLLEPSVKLSEVAGYYHKDWKKEDFASLYEEVKNIQK